MRSDITISNIEDKDFVHLEVIEKSYLKKIETLKRFLSIANDYDIELIDMQRSMVKEKIYFYDKQYLKVKQFKRWKYEHNCGDERTLMGMWLELSVDDFNRIRINFDRLKKLRRVLKKKNTNH